MHQSLPAQWQQHCQSSSKVCRLVCCYCPIETVRRSQLCRNVLQAKLLPAVPAHAASFLGDRICLSAALNGAKISITTHSNAYVGHLRQQVATDACSIL